MVARIWNSSGLGKKDISAVTSGPETERARDPDSWIQGKRGLGT